MSCKICDKTGYYPIYDVYGQHAYDIVCPECHGFQEQEELPLPAEGEQLDLMGLLRASVEHEAQKQKNPPQGAG